MDLEYKLKRGTKWTLYIPQITASEKKEIRHLKKIIKFLQNLENSISAYAESGTFPDGAKYFAECTFNDGSLQNMRLELTLKVRGRTIHQRCILYTWLKGKITNVEFIESK